MNTVRTYQPSLGEIEEQRKWHLIDASGHTLGRLASRIARLLRGKHKPIFVPHLDVGDYVVVINAEKVTLTGDKMEQKKYYRYSGYPGGLKAKNAREILDTHPERLIQLAVKGMMPKNKLGRKMLKKLKVYAGSDHPHEAQCPEELKL